MKVRAAARASIRSLPHQPVAAVLIVLSSCVAPPDPGDSVLVANPHDPELAIESHETTLRVCRTICEALVDDYGVPVSEYDACTFQCASGFVDHPQDCYEVVACIASHQLCDGTDVSADCLARSGACIASWGIINGTCRGCWAPNRSVHGNEIVTFETTQGPVQVPQDYSNLTIAAHLPGAPGMDYVFPGEGFSDGTYVIPDVPGCGVWIQVGSKYTWAGNADVDTSYSFPGRNDAAIGGPGTSLTLQVGNLVPWDPSDWLEYFIPELGYYAGGFWALIPNGDSSKYPTGTTSVAWSFDLEGWALLDGARGDHMFVGQLASQHLADGTLLRTLRRAAQVTGQTVKNGMQNVLQVTLAEVPSTLTAHFDWRRSTYARHRSEWNPSTILESASAGIITHFGRKNMGNSGELILIEAAAGDSDLLPLDVPFGTPYPATFGMTVNAGIASAVTLTPRSGESVVKFQGLVTNVPYDRFQGAPIEAGVGPVRNLTIDGRSAFERSAGGSPTPTLRWDPPSVGEPTAYRIAIRRIVSIEDMSTSPLFTIPVSDAGPPRTQMTVPPGAMNSGEDYFFTVEAIVEHDERVDAASVLSAEYLP